MELKVIGKNVEILEAVERYIRKKIDKLARYLPGITEAKVEVYEEKTRSPEQRFVVQVTLERKGILLRSEERAKDIYTAIDFVSDTLARQIERYKGKLYEKGRGVSLARQGANPEETPEAEEIKPIRKVVKIKRFPVKPMSVDEATEQMELLGHDFFIFVNADTGDINLLYRRKDGNYGLIEPELA